MKSKKIFLITAGVIMIMLGLCVYVYPAYNTWNTDRNMRRQMEAFQARNEAAIQKENNTGDSTNSNEETAEARSLEELYSLLEQYNLSLYQEGQKITDPFFYEAPVLDLSPYGLKDNLFGFIEIPKMDITLGIYLGATKENMALGAVHLTQTSMPIGGINTNAVIAAHRGTRSHGDMFRQIQKLEQGDTVKITNPWETLEYEVVETEIILPTDLERIRIFEDRDMVTLVTCHPYGNNTHRYLVYCERVDGSEVGKGE